MNRPPADEPGYRPAEYWSHRLEHHPNLRGTGHISYSEAYNRWLYRAKRRALRRALRGVATDARALDVGSGTGWVVAELLNRGASVEGCDIAESALRQLRERFPGPTFFAVELGMDSLPRPAATYDLITALDVTYHITDDTRWHLAVTELARVLRAGGRLVVSDGLGTSDARPADHVCFRSRAAWISAASHADMRLEAVHPYYRWLSRDRRDSWSDLLPDGVRGMIEYGLELTVPRPPHMRYAIFTRGQSGSL
jgi:SAM-dependent methyltransferase